ncbi:DUF2953 domain-containing protein [Bacillus sp. B-jedd]|uniref:DUF2953 domain-containing protein n=1 Tax=Bacillus sp. B-jedd TaxID=1476857 RepID=UPI0005156380|nr:DUF2953 domain-containing protein [Bacillus sp. B-jedd]CEG28210.1 sporulation protein YtfI [Bacillus sp. B-jedd]
MGWLLVALLLIGLFIVLLLFIKVTLTVQYTYQGSRHELNIRIAFLFGLIDMEIPVPEFINKANNPSDPTEGKPSPLWKEAIRTEDWPEKLNNLKEAADIFLRTQGVLNKFLLSTTIKRFEWRTAAGTGDAAMTGMVAGSIWGIKAGIIKLLEEHTKFKAHPIVEVIPYFQFRVAATSLRCMITFRAGKAIAAGIRFYRNVKIDRRHGTHNLPALQGEEGRSY